MNKSALYILLFSILHISKVYSQNAQWKYFRSSNTGISGDYHQVIKIDRFGNKWTGGFMPFWSEGSVVRYNDTAWTCWSNFESFLPADRVYDLVFDNNSELWVATNGVGNGVAHGGIAHYDGSSWTQFTTLNTPLPEDDIRGICIDGNNNVWATFYNVNSGIGGIAKYDRINWTIYTPSNSNLQTGHVDKIIADNQNNIWIGTNLGMVKFDGLNWILFLNGKNITDVEYDGITNKVYAVSGGAIDIFDGATWNQINSTNAPISSTGLWAVAARGDSLIITTVGGTYLSYLYDGMNWSSHPEIDHTYDARIDLEGNFWRCGIGFLDKYDGSNWTRYTRFNTGLTSYFLGDNLFIDSRNRKWFSTNDNGGISMFDCPVWEDYGLLNQNVWPQPLQLGINGSSATEDTFGNIWMSYYAGGIVKIPNGDVHNPGAWVSYPAGVISNATCQIIAADSAGDVWADGGCGLVIQFNHLTGNWIPHNLYNMGLPCGSNSKMYTIKPNPNNNQVWFCTEAGIAIYDSGSWTIMSQMNGTLPFQGSYYDVAFDTQNNAWVATDSGLLKLTGNFWTVYNPSNSALISNHLSALTIDTNGLLYITSYNYSTPLVGGLNIFDGNTGWQTFNAYSSPIVHHQLSDIAIDQSGNVWMTTLPYGAIIYNPNGVQGFECMDQTLQTGTTTGSISTESLDNYKANVFPNPAVLSVTVSFCLAVSGNVSFQIADIAGKIVHDSPSIYAVQGLNRISIDVSHLNDGMYFCRIKTNKGIQIAKLMKQRR